MDNTTYFWVSNLIEVLLDAEAVGSKYGVDLCRFMLSAYNLDLDDVPTAELRDTVESLRDNTFEAAAAAILAAPAAPSPAHEVVAYF